MYRPPEAPAASDESLDRFAGMLKGRHVAVLTGAGCSTESGIPDYRSPGQRERVRRPIQHLEFVQSARTRAGSRSVIELHGVLERVRCLGCAATLHRDVLQERLMELNPGFAEAFAAELRPDGDAELPPEVDEIFQVPPCEGCGGVLKPDVVFFGDNVAPDLVADAFARVEAADALLVVGSSLTVYSGYRFVKRAADRALPIAIINCGETRADPLATLRLDALASDVLPRLAVRLT